MSDELIRQARSDYDNLIVKIVTWPPGLGIDVHLIGGDVVQYHPSGEKYAVDQPTASVKARRRLAVLRGVIRRALGRP